MSEDEGVQFHEEAAERIVRAVRHVEDSIIRQPPARRRVLDGEGREGLVVKTQAEHKRGETKACTIMIGSPGEEAESDQEVDCTNLFADLQDAIAIAVPIGGAGYYLVAAECPPEPDPEPDPENEPEPEEDPEEEGPE